MKRTYSAVLLAFGFTALLAAADSSTDPKPPTDDTVSAGTTTAAPAPNPDNATAPSVEGPLSRWLDITNFYFALRYRSAFDVDGVHNFNQGQQKSLLSGKLKLDKDGKYTVGFRFSSGGSFDWSYADFVGGGVTQANLKSLTRFASLADQQDALASGVGEATFPSGGWAFVPREVYFSAKPMAWIEFQYGSLGINRGVNSEITSYDDDGYLAGGRIIVRQPQHFYFDEISVTYGDLAYLYTPNFFARLQSIEHFNYHQFLVRKKVTPWLEVSTDYTYDIVHTMREAVKVTTKKFNFADSVRVEAYQRLNSVNLNDDVHGFDSYPSASGLAVSAEKTFAKRVTITAGFADIDDNYDVYNNSGADAIWGHPLNGDIYGIGKRPFVRANIKLNSYVSLFGFYTHIIDFNYARDGFIWNSEALYSGVQIDFKAMLKAAKWL
jgi:hypothetical protein